jgi:hypothetical protein
MTVGMHAKAKASSQFTLFTSHDMQNIHRRVYLEPIIFVCVFLQLFQMKHTEQQKPSEGERERGTTTQKKYEQT